MGKSTLEIFYTDLVSELWLDLIFFIPDKDIPSDFIDSFKHLDTQKLFNEVLVFDNQNGPVFYEKGRGYRRTLLKGVELDKNIFKLLEKKSGTNQYEFNYVLEKYFEQVGCLFFIANWLNNNLQLIIQLDQTAIGLFKIQQTYYKKHLAALIKHFYPDKKEIPQGNFNVLKAIEKYFPNIIEQYKDKEKIIPPSPQVPIQNDQLPDFDKENGITDLNKHLPKVEIKQPLITEMEAERLLLEAVFNLDLKFEK